MTGQAPVEEGAPGSSGDDDVDAFFRPDGDERYRRREWRAALTPALVVLAVVALLVVAWYLVADTGPEAQLLDDVDAEGSFNLLGHWRDGLTAYGSHVHAINLTLESGDELVLSFSSNGPPEGIQVRLQHPLHPTDGTGGAGGTQVFASSTGGNGTIRFFVQEGGAYQVYFWHPGSARPPGAGDDPDDHTTAAVAHHLVVTRAHRP